MTWDQLRFPFSVWRAKPTTPIRPFVRSVPNRLRAASTRRRGALSFAEQQDLHRRIVLIVHGEPDQMGMLRKMFPGAKGPRSDKADRWAERIIREQNERVRATIEARQAAERDRCELGMMMAIMGATGTER